MKIVNKVAIFSIPIITVLLFFYCSDKSTNSSPNNGPESTVTVDAAGGTLATDDFELTVPAGAFSNETTLSVETSDEERAFGDDAVTDGYLITGLPEAFNGNLRVSLKIQGTLNGQGAIAIGALGRDSETGDSVMVYSARAAEDSAGYLVTTLGIHGENEAIAKLSHKSEDEEKPLLSVVGFGHYEKTESYDHFEITASGLFRTVSVDAFNQKLETAYEKIVTDMQLPFQNIPYMHPGAENWNRWYTWDFPIRIHAVDRQNIARRTSIRQRDGHPHSPVINLDEALLGSSHASEVIPLAGPVLTKICLETYSRLNHSWIIWAVEAWSEEIFSDPSSFTAPRKFIGNEMAPFYGFEGEGYPMDFNDKNNIHPYGMAALIKYLTESPAYGIGGIKKTFQRIKERQEQNQPYENPSTSLLYTVNELVTEWLPDFFEMYVGGKIYNVSHEIFTDEDNLSGEWTVDTKDDDEISFKSSDTEVGSYPDLGAKLFLVNFGNSELRNSDQLIIDPKGDLGDDGLSVIVFAVHSDRLESLGRTSASEENPVITDLLDNTDMGVKKYLIVMVNGRHNATYRGFTDIDLKLQFVKGEDPVDPTDPTDPTDPAEIPDLNKCEIDLRVNTDYLTVRADGSTHAYSAGVIESNYIDTYGELTESVFTGESTGPYSVGTVYNTVSLIFNQDLKMILSLDWDHTYSVEDAYDRHIHLIAENIPVDELQFSHGIFIYELEGEVTCPAITTLEYDGTNYDWNGTSTTTLTGSPTCDWLSHIRVVLKEE
ncbi:hypothetical protein ACFL4L_03070 [bacterium]